MPEPEDDYEAVRSAVITEARAIVDGLFAKYGIDDPTQAHRFVRERFDGDDLERYKKALAVLMGTGALG